MVDSLTVSTGDLTITGHLRILKCNFKMGNPAQTVLSQSGTARPTWGTGCTGVPVQMQVQTFNTKYTHTANPSTTWSDTGYYVNISPFFSNSNILVRLTTCITHHVGDRKSMFQKIHESTHGLQECIMVMVQLWGI